MARTEERGHGRADVSYGGIVVTVLRVGGRIVFEGDVSLDARGRASRSFGIEELGTYRIVASHGMPSGSATVTVSAAQGRPCPAP